MASFGVDGGTLFASVGFDTAKTGTASLRTKSRGGAEMAGGRIPGHSRVGAADTRRKSIGWTRWDYVRTIKWDGPTDDAAKHRLFGGPGSVSDATWSRRSPIGGGWPS